MTLQLLLLGDAPVARLVERARLAEANGYSAVWVADERFYREVYSCLGQLVAHTSKVLLGPCVTDPFARHPALTAMAIGTLDEISGGRAILGIGAGISGFAELGIERNAGVRPYLPLLPLITDRHVDALTLAGTVDEVTEHAIALREAGADGVIARPFAPVGGTIEETIVTLGSEVWSRVLRWPDDGSLVALTSLGLSPPGRAWYPAGLAGAPPDGVRSDDHARSGGEFQPDPTAGRRVAHARGDLSGCDDQSGRRQLRCRTVAVRRPRRAPARGRLSRT
jgi:hypothetical protein